MARLDTLGRFDRLRRRDPGRASDNPLAFLNVVGGGAASGTAGSPGGLLVLLAFVGLGCSLGLMATITVPLARQLARRTGLKIKFFDPWLL